MSGLVFCGLARKLLRPKNQFELKRGSSNPAPFGAMCAAVPPLCPCGSHRVAQLKKPDLRSAWASREGVSWSHSAREPYFFFCQRCHMGIWPEDVRPPNSNRNCRPGQPSWTGKGERKRALLGDLCITQAPLEPYSAAACAPLTRPAPATKVVSAYSQHTVNIQSTYSQHTVNIQST